MNRTVDVDELKKEISETVDSITKKMEVLENRADDAVQNIKDTGEGIKKVVTSLNVKDQFEKHPWLCFGITVAAGALVGRRLVQPASTGPATPSIVRPLAYGAGIIAAGQIAKKKLPGLGDEISALQGILLTRLK